MAVAVGDQYRNTTGTSLNSAIPADAVATVRQVDPGEEDTAHYGTLVLEFLSDEPDVGGAIGLTEDDLARDWEAV